LFLANFTGFSEFGEYVNEYTNAKLSNSNDC